MNTAERVRSMATELRNAHFGVRDVRIVTDNSALADCPWCAECGPCAATIEILHDAGMVLSCPHCVLTAACEAADKSTDGWFWVEITERRAA